MATERQKRSARKNLGKANAAKAARQQQRKAAGAKGRATQRARRR